MVRRILDYLLCHGGGYPDRPGISVIILSIDWIGFRACPMRDMG